MKTANLIALLIASFALVSCGFEGGINGAETSSDTHDFTETKGVEKHPLALTYIGLCIQNMPRVEKIEAVAKINEWEPLVGDMLAALGPVEPGVDMKGWLANRGEEDQFFVGITQGLVDNKEIRNCTIAYKTSEKSELIRSVVNTVASYDEPRNVIEEAGQRYRMWNYENLNDNFVLAVMDAPDLAPDVTTISTMYTQP